MPSASDATVEATKLAGYALNPEHPKGQHKARLFRDVLAITAEDAEYLAAQPPADKTRSRPLATDRRLGRTFRAMHADRRTR